VPLVFPTGRDVFTTGRDVFPTGRDVFPTRDKGKANTEGPEVARLRYWPK
jgi:hypothetical protein